MTEYCGIEYNELAPKGPWLYIKTTNDEENKIIDGIYIPMSKDEKISNARVGAAQIISLGDEAREYGLAEKDYILYDYYAATTNHGNAFLKASNALAKITEEEFYKFVNGTLKQIY